MSLTISAARIVEESNSPLVAAPESWPRRRLAEAATILNGFAFKSRQFVPEGGVPLIRIRDIFKEETAVGYVGDYDARYLVQQGELLVGMDGDFNAARWSGPTALLNQRVCKISPDPALLDLDYLTFVLPGYLQAIHEYTSSTTVMHLSSKDIADIPLPVPTLDEQRLLSKTIAGVSKHQREAGRHLEQARRAIERFRRAVLVAACSGRLTEDWRTVENLPEWDVDIAANVCDKVQSGGTPKSGFIDTAGVPFLKVYNLVGQRVNFDYRPQFVPHDVHNGVLRKSVAYPGDVIMNIVGPPLGKVAIVPGDFPEWNLNQAITLFRPGRRILKDWLYYYLRSGVFMDEDLITRGSAGQSNISLTQCRRLLIPIPSLDEQAEIVRRVAELLARADEITSRVEVASRRVDQSSQAALAKAFRGELRTTNLTARCAGA